MFIDKLDEWGWIRKEEPLWWDLDYSKDPRELLTITEFEKRLKYLGKYPLFKNRDNTTLDINIYVGDKVPVTVLDVKIKDMKIPLFITVRPYTYKESINSISIPYDIINDDEKQKKTEYDLIKILEREGYWAEDSRLSRRKIMFLPHVRGFFKEKKKKRFFYYDLKHSFLGLLEKIPFWEPEILYALKKIKKDYFIFMPSNLSITDRSRQSLDELMNIESILKIKSRKGKRGRWNPHSRPPGRPKPGVKTIEWIGSEQVVYDDFELNEKDLISYFPIRLRDMKEAMPIAISTRTHPYGKDKGAFVLGVFFQYNEPTLRVVPFTDKDFAYNVSQQISKELGFDFKSIILEHSPGKNHYKILD